MVDQLLKVLTIGEPLFISKILCSDNVSWWLLAIRVCDQGLARMKCSAALLYTLRWCGAVLGTALLCLYYLASLGACIACSARCQHIL